MIHPLIQIFQKSKTKNHFTDFFCRFQGLWSVAPAPEACAAADGASVTAAGLWPSPGCPDLVIHHPERVFFRHQAEHGLDKLFP
jgi:hypothetical protein